MSKTATFLATNGMIRGDARAYRLTEPLLDHEGIEHHYVLTIAPVDVDVVQGCVLFPSDSEGNILSWRTLPITTTGMGGPDETLTALGYEVIV